MTTVVISKLTLAARKRLGYVRDSASNVANDIAQGFFEITHNGFALLGLALVFAVITLTARPDLRQHRQLLLDLVPRGAGDRLAFSWRPDADGVPRSQPWRSPPP